jgi:predicted phage terminase large subunit-like protein
MQALPQPLPPDIEEDQAFDEVQIGFENEARQHLVAFACFNDPKYDPSNFHWRYSGLLEDAVLKKTRRRLIVTTPPRHGKTRLASEELPAFLLGLNPSIQIACASYAQALSMKASKACRRRVVSPIYQKLFPNTIIRKDEGAANEWATTAGGGYKAVGIDSQFTGSGADVLIIDDPHKDRGEAESKKMRDNVWDWYVSTAMTRLSPDAIVIIIQTRWHKDDLSGRLLDAEYQDDLVKNEGAAEQFQLVNFPALALDDANDPLGRKEGDALWPERWTEAKLKAKRASIPGYDWQALYMGEPTNKRGNFEVLDNIVWIERDQVPPHIELQRTWDLAVADGEENDFSVGALVGFDHTSVVFQEANKETGQKEIRKPKGDFYIVHIKRIKQRWPSTKKSILDLLAVERNRVTIEAIGAFQALFDELKKARATELGGAGVLRMVTKVDNKITRSLPWYGLMEVGKVYVVNDLFWKSDFLDEIGAFPNGPHDDIVDAISLGYEQTHKKNLLLWG